MYKVLARNCRKFGVPSSGIEHNYACVIKYIFEMRVGYMVRFVFSHLWVIEHLSPLFLHTANVLCGENKAPSWNYESIYLTNNSVASTVSSSARFRLGLRG